MRSIVPPLILSAVLVAHGMRVDLPTERGQVSNLGLAGSFLLALLIGGFNETIAALQVAALTLACILSRAMPGWNTRRLMTGLLLAASLGAATAIIIVVLSPGNSIRQAFYPPPPALPQLLEMAWANFGSFLVGLVRTPEKTLAILGCLAVSAFMGSQLRQAQASRWTVGAILAAGIGLAFASFVPSAYGLSDSPPERTLLVPAHILTLMLTCGGFFLGGLLWPTAVRQSAPHIATAVLLMACALLMSSSSLSIGRLLTSRANYIRYAEHWNAVDLQIRSARNRGETVIWIQPINNWAGLNEPNDNPKFWLNLCLREYYGIEVLGLDIP